MMVYPLDSRRRRRAVPVDWNDSIEMHEVEPTQQEESLNQSPSPPDTDTPSLDEGYEEQLLETAL